MKKKIFMCMNLILVILLVGCSEKKRELSVSEDIQKLGTAAVETADEYLDGKITADEAMNRLRRTYSSAKKFYDDELEEFGTETLAGTDYSQDLNVVYAVLFLKNKIRDKNDGIRTNQEVIDERDFIAEIVGLKKR